MPKSKRGTGAWVVVHELDKCPATVQQVMGCMHARAK
jgi:hypothetical protein